MRLSDLTDIQKSHLIWRFDHKTAMGGQYIVKGCDK